MERFHARIVGRDAVQALRRLQLRHSGRRNRQPVTCDELIDVAASDVEFGIGGQDGDQLILAGIFGSLWERNRKNTVYFTLFIHFRIGPVTESSSVFGEKTSDIWL